MASKSSVCICLVGFLGLAFLVTGCLLIHFLPQLINNQIKDNVKITPGSEAFKNWESPKSPIYFQIYVFDVENYKDVLNGSRPSLVQKGPYTYREEREKFNITFQKDKGTVSYRQSTTYFFVPEMSAGLENDTFHCINIPMVTILNKVRDEYSLIKKGLDWILKKTGEKLFLELSVGEILWGYNDLFLTEVHSFASKLGFSVPDVFGLFLGTNGTDDGVYEIYTGEVDLDKIGEIVSWKGQPHLDFWTSNTSNLINGSDGTMYAPFIDTKETKYLFSSDVCRSLNMDYTEGVSNRGISMDRFVAPEFMFANVSVNPSNKGFCTPPGDCLPSGLLNVSTCRDAPIVMSMPHFLGCDQDIIDSVDGLHPRQSEHESFLDIEPMTGVVMRVAKRLQINLYVEEIDGFPETAKLGKRFMPVLWLNESALIDNKDAESFKSAVFGKIKLTNIIKYCLIGLGGLIMLIVIAVLARKTFCGQIKYIRFGVNDSDELHNAAGDSMIS